MGTQPPVAPTPPLAGKARPPDIHAQHPPSVRIPGQPESSEKEKEAFLRQKSPRHIGAKRWGLSQNIAALGEGPRKCPHCPLSYARPPVPTPTHTLRHTRAGGRICPRDAPTLPPVVASPAAEPPGPPVGPTGPGHQLPGAPSPSLMTRALPQPRAARSQLPAWAPVTPSPTGVPTTAGRQPGLAARPPALQNAGVGGGKPRGKAGGPRGLAQCPSEWPVPGPAPQDSHPACSPFQPGRGQGSPTPLKSPSSFSPGRVPWRCPRQALTGSFIHSTSSHCALCVSGVGSMAEVPVPKGRHLLGRTDSDQATEQTNLKKKKMTLWREVP